MAVSVGMTRLLCLVLVNFEYNIDFL